MEADLAVALQSLGAPALTGPLVLATRRSFYEAVLRLFADDRCADETRWLVREYLSGRREDDG
jgi:hypothetical protein